MKIVEKARRSRHRKRRNCFQIKMAIFRARRHPQKSCSWSRKARQKDGERTSWRQVRTYAWELLNEIWLCSRLHFIRLRLRLRLWFWFQFQFVSRRNWHKLFQVLIAVSLPLDLFSLWGDPHSSNLCDQLNCCSRWPKLKKKSFCVFFFVFNFHKFHLNVFLIFLRGGVKAVPILQ